MAAPHPDHIADVEAQALSAALADDVACATLVAMVRPESYSRADHCRLAAVVERLFSEGSPVNLSTVAAAGAPRDAVLRVTEAFGAPSNVGYFGLLVLEAHMARTTRDALARALAEAERAVAGEADVFDVVDAAQARLSSLVLDAAAGARADTHVRHAVAEALVRVGEWEEGVSSDFAPSGFYTLDATAGGLPVGELTTLAAHTGAGKTALLGQAARTVALSEVSAAEAGRRERPRPVVLFSAEMSREQLVHRMASGLSGLDLRALRTGRAPEAAYREYSRALGRLAALEIHVDDAPSPTLSHVAARLTAVAARAGEPCFVGVDYDEKVATEGATEELRVSAIARGLKDVAKRYRVPVVALSQYGRKADMHRKVPTNDWLRYSGKKEQESALIVHWMWPRYWTDKGFADDAVARFDPARPDRGWLVVSKNRFGGTGDIPLDFHPQTVTFRDPGEPGQRYSAAELADRPPTRDPGARLDLDATPPSAPPVDYDAEEPF